jgi:nucleoside-diphosphate-sugar epimerase
MGHDESSNPMRVLVTGATGYVGGAIARALAADGREVVGTARDEAGASRLRASGYSVAHADLAEPASFGAAARDVDAVVHAAAVNGAERASADRAAVEAMLAALSGGSGAFVYTSGTWVLGDTGDAVANEKWPCRPLPVNAWQLEVEELVQSSATGGLRTAIVRPATVHGQGDGSLGALVAQARKKGVVRVVGSGHQIWSTVHIDDLADLYARVLRGIDAGGIFHGASGCGYPARDLALAAAIAAGRGAVQEWPIDEARARLGEIADALGMTQRVEASRARTVAGWVPRGPTAIEDLLAGSYREG